MQKRFQIKCKSGRGNCFSSMRTAASKTHISGAVLKWGNPSRPRFCFLNVSTVRSCPYNSSPWNICLAIYKVAYVAHFFFAEMPRFTCALPHWTVVSVCSIKKGPCVTSASNPQSKWEQLADVIHCCAKNKKRLGFQFCSYCNVWWVKGIR